MTLTIKFYCTESTHPYLVRIAKSRVSGKTVEAIVDSFNAPDLFRVNMHNGEGACYYVDGAFNRADFLRWWKVAKLGR